LANYREAYAMWAEYGRVNGLILTPGQRRKYEEDAAKTTALGPLGTIPPDLTDDQLAGLGLRREWVKARKALIYYQQNQSVSNFPYFLASTEAEASRELVDARILIGKAARLDAKADIPGALKAFVAANAKWRVALQKYPAFHNGERTETTQESTADLQVKLMKRLADDRKVAALQSLIGVSSADRELATDLAEAEANTLIALAILEGLDPAAAKRTESVLPGGKYAWLKGFTSERRDVPWLNPGFLEAVKMKEGLMRKPIGPPPGTMQFPDGVPQPQPPPGAPGGG